MANFLRREPTPPEVPPTAPLKLPEHNIENEIRELIRKRPQQRDPLSPDAADLMSKAIIDAAQKVATETQNAADRYLKEAQELKTEVDRWAEVLMKQAQEAAENIATRHASFRDTAKRIRDIIDPGPGNNGNADVVEEIPDWRKGRTTSGDEM